MLENLQRFRALERPAQTLFLRALVALPLVALSLKCRGFDKTRATLQKMFSCANSELNSGFSKKRARLVAHAVNSADRHGLAHFSCLTKSLTLWWLLGRQGISSHLRIGVRKENNRLEAHAWLERDGLVVSEPEEQHRHYAAFDTAFANLPEKER